jgi:hypothetical protein
VPYELNLDDDENEFRTNVYKLKGFIKHSNYGDSPNVDNGHYIYYGFDYSINTCYIYDDSTVREIRINNIEDYLHSSDIYYYERIHQ